MKNFKYLFLFLFFSNFWLVSAQDISFKKGIIYIDEKECMKYDGNANNVTYQNLKGDDLFILKFVRVDGILYNKVIFVETGQSFTSQNYIFTKKLLFEKLLKGNAIENCELNEEKVRTFIMKFDEKVEERLNKTNGNQTIIIKDDAPKSGVNINIGR